MAINWTQFNVPTIIAVLGVGWGVANYISKIDSRVQAGEDYRISRSKQTDDNFKLLNTRIDVLAQTYQDIPYRVGSTEKGIEALTLRQDRLSDLLLGNVDALRKDVNSLGTKFEVMSSKLDDVLPQKRTQLERSDVPVPN